MFLEYGVIKFNYMFFFLYILAAYLRKYTPEKNVKNYVFGSMGILFFIIEILSIFCIRYHNLKTGNQTEFWKYIWGMEKLPCVLTSVSFFIFFANLKVKYNKIIGFISSSLFAVYLLHIGRLWKLFFRILFNNEKTFYTNLMLPQIILCSVSIFTVAILLDKVRIYVFERPLFAFFQKKNK